MKKIVALVLSLVMVLGLATTAFAAPDKYDMYKADKTLNAMLALETPSAAADPVNITEYAAKTNADGSGNVAYLFINFAGTDQGAYYVKTTTPTTDSYAVTAHGKTDILFYVDAIGFQPEVFYYKAAVKEFTDFGLKCGQFYYIPDADDVFFQTVAGVIYKATDDVVADQDNNYLLDGEVVSADLVFGAKAAIDHEFAVTNYAYDSVKKVNVPTEATCTTCLLKTTNIYKDGKVPATYTEYDLVAGFKVGLAPAGVVAPSTPVVDGDKVESAETFDAGIAMYVGMSVMAAAGSAVVLKKKD